MQVIDQLKQYLSNEGLSVLKVSEKTGISAYKIYKWLSGKARPKHEDSVKIEKWLKDCLEEVPNQKKDEKQETAKSTNVHTETLIRELQEHNKTLQENNEALKAVTLKQLEEHQRCLDDLGKSIKENQVLLVSLLSSQTVKADVIMEALDEIRGKRKGSLGEESHKREQRFRDEVKDRSRKDVSGNAGKN